MSEDVQEAMRQIKENPYAHIERKKSVRIYSSGRNAAGRDLLLKNNSPFANKLNLSSNSHICCEASVPEVFLFKIIFFNKQIKSSNSHIWFQASVPEV